MAAPSDIDDLFQLPVTEYTAARNALAASLKAAGRTKDATAVKALPKPSLSAWTVNQLYWRHRKAFNRLMAAGERLTNAQASQLAGRGGELRAPIEAHRAALGEAITRAAALLRNAGHAPAPDLTRRIATTLEALGLLWRPVICARRPPDARCGPARVRGAGLAGATQRRRARRRAEPRHPLPSTSRAEPPEEAGCCREEAGASGSAQGAARSGNRGTSATPNARARSGAPHAGHTFLVV